MKTPMVSSCSSNQVEGDGKRNQQRERGQRQRRGRFRLVCVVACRQQHPYGARGQRRQEEAFVPVGLCDAQCRCEQQEECWSREEVRSLTVSLTTLSGSPAPALMDEVYS